VRIGISAFLGALLAVCPLLDAQSTFGTVLGTVTGAAISGAKLKLRNVERGTSATADSSEQGFSDLLNLAPGDIKSALSEMHSQLSLAQNSFWHGRRAVRFVIRKPGFLNSANRLLFVSAGRRAVRGATFPENSGFLKMLKTNTPVQCLGASPFRAPAILRTVLGSVRDNLGKLIAGLKLTLRNLDRGTLLSY
jgi:hypothetical protein